MSCHPNFAITTKSSCPYVKKGAKLDVSGIDVEKIVQTVKASSSMKRSTTTTASCPQIRPDSKVETKDVNVDELIDRLRKFKTRNG